MICVLVGQQELAWFAGMAGKEKCYEERESTGARERNESGSHEIRNPSSLLAKVSSVLLANTY